MTYKKARNEILFYMAFFSIASFALAYVLRDADLQTQLGFFAISSVGFVLAFFFIFVTFKNYARQYSDNALFNLTKDRPLELIEDALPEEEYGNFKIIDQIYDFIGQFSYVLLHKAGKEKMAELVHLKRELEALKDEVMHAIQQYIPKDEVQGKRFLHKLNYDGSRKNIFYLHASLAQQWQGLVLFVDHINTVLQYKKKFDELSGQAKAKMEEIEKLQSAAA